MRDIAALLAVWVVAFGFGHRSGYRAGLDHERARRRNRNKHLAATYEEET